MHHEVVFIGGPRGGERRAVENFSESIVFQELAGPPDFCDMGDKLLQVPRFRTVQYKCIVSFYDPISGGHKHFYSTENITPGELMVKALMAYAEKSRVAEEPWLNRTLD